MDSAKVSKRLQPVLAEAHELLLRAYGQYMGTDSLGHFDVADPSKGDLISGGNVLGTFSAWRDCLSLTLDQDPLGTAVHELLHANAFSDDWLPADTGKPEVIVSFRGFEIQVLASADKHVQEVHHRALNEAVTELLTHHAYSNALEAYANLIPFARELDRAVGLPEMARVYFQSGYEGLEDIAADRSLDLEQLSKGADDAARGHS